VYNCGQHIFCGTCKVAIKAIVPSRIKSSLSSSSTWDSSLSKPSVERCSISLATYELYQQTDIPHTWTNMAETKTVHCEKKLGSLLFDFGIVNKTDDDCEQVLTITLCLQQMMTPVVWLYMNILWSGASTTGDRINIYTYSHMNIWKCMEAN